MSYFLSLPDQHHQSSIIDIQRRSLAFTGTRSFARTVSLTPKSFLHGTLSRRICPRFLPRNYAPFLAIISQTRRGRGRQLDNAQTTSKRTILVFIKRATLAKKNGSDPPAFRAVQLNHAFHAVIWPRVNLSSRLASNF